MEIRWGRTSPFCDPFTLGGFLNLSGYARNQLFGTSFALAETVFVCQLSSGGAIIQSTYLGASAEAGNAWLEGQARTLGDLRGAGSVFLAADTLLGPFCLASGHGGSKHKSFYVILSQSF